VAAKGESIKNFSLGLVPFVIIVGILGWLIMSQPDMGTTIITLLIAGTIFFLSGAPLSHLSLLVVGGGLVMTLLVFVSGYRMDRITSFIAPETDPAGVGFHIIQLLIALGSGGLTGLGWGVSRQKFFYIPGAHTDGVFAIIGEEVGFIGAIIIVALYFVLVYRGIRIAINAPDRFGALLALGVTCWIAYQAIINIGGITRTMPLTGVPLPFISYGGSALASLMAGVGILLSVSRYSRELSQAEREAANTGQRWLPQRQEAT
jgi:cell division protein FtsW